MNPLNVKNQAIWTKSIPSDVSFEDFQIEVKNLKGWEYQYVILYLAMTRPNERNSFLRLITRKKDFDPMLVAINPEFDYKTKVGPFLLDVLKDLSITNREIILETFFPVRVRQENLDIDYIKAHLNEMSNIGVRISLLTVVITYCLFVYYDPVELKETWKLNYDGQPFSQMYLSDETFEIDTLYMIVDGNGSDLNIGDNECKAVMAMVDIAESFLDVYENNFKIEITASKDVDEESTEGKEEEEQKKQEIASAFGLYSRRDISDHFYLYQKFAIYYNRIFSEFVTNMSDSRFIYWNTLTLLFSQYKINPYFILYEDRFKIQKYQKRYLTCMMQVLIRLKNDIELIDSGHTPYDAYSYEVNVIGRNKMVERESLVLVYVYFVLLAADQINLIINTNKFDRDLIASFCHEKLEKQTVGKLVNKVGFILLYQISDFLITYANPKFADSVANPLFPDKKPVTDTGLENLVFNMNNMTFSGDGTNTESRVLYFDGNNYLLTSILDRFSILHSYNKKVKNGEIKFELN